MTVATLFSGGNGHTKTLRKPGKLDDLHATRALRGIFDAMPGSKIPQEKVQYQKSLAHTYGFLRKALLLSLRLLSPSFLRLWGKTEPGRLRKSVLCVCFSLF
ncbi:hypothetical protein [Pseudooceanicola algae]|uniref:hypothetical protein n=1 Tax=Pseudooceanicola algae TaxID=1537215 RepID=UPI0011C455B2|nr:hypothetical protein [Pseudooceanicola algae]